MEDHCSGGGDGQGRNYPMVSLIRLCSISIKE